MHQEKTYSCKIKCFLVFKDWVNSLCASQWSCAVLVSSFFAKVNLKQKECLTFLFTSPLNRIKQIYSYYKAVLSITSQLNLVCV